MTQKSNDHAVVAFLVGANKMPFPFFLWERRCLLCKHVSQHTFAVIDKHFRYLIAFCFFIDCFVQGAIVKLINGRPGQSQ